VFNTTERKGSEITKETNVNIHINKDSSLVLIYSSYLKRPKMISIVKIWNCLFRRLSYNYWIRLRKIR
jgi:hypothetical protein